MSDSMLTRESALRITMFREAAGLTKAQVAEQVGTSAGTAWYAECPAYLVAKNPTVDAYRLWSGGFVRSPHWENETADTPALREQLRRELRSRRVRAALRDAKAAAEAADAA